MNPNPNASVLFEAPEVSIQPNTDQKDAYVMLTETTSAQETYKVVGSTNGKFEIQDVSSRVLLQLDRTVVLWIAVEQVQALLLYQWQNTLGCCRSQVDQVVQVVHSHARR